jgi:hypothetical protein
VLRRSGPDVAEPKPSGQYNFAFLALPILNFGIRPLLARWHPALTDWESHRPAGASILDHEHAWPRAAELRADLETARQALTDYTAALATACGVPNLLEPSPSLDEDALSGRRVRGRQAPATVVSNPCARPPEPTASQPPSRSHLQTSPSPETAGGRPLAALSSLVRRQGLEPRTR